MNTATFVNQITRLNITHIISWPKLAGEYNKKPLDFYIYKLSRVGCLKPLKKFQLKKYMRSRTFWNNKEVGIFNTVVYELNLSNCRLNWK